MSKRIGLEVVAYNIYICPKCVHFFHKSGDPFEDPIMMGHCDGATKVREVRMKKKDEWKAPSPCPFYLNPKGRKRG